MHNERLAERGKADVSHAVFALTARAFAPIGKTGADILQLGNLRLQDTHRASESKIAARRQAKSSNTAGEGDEIRDLLHFRLAKRLQRAGSVYGEATYGCDSIAFRTAGP
jgi:hypothetical protein